MDCRNEDCLRLRAQAAGYIERFLKKRGINVETEFSEVRFHGDKERAAAVYQGFKPLSADDVAEAIAYVVNLPEHVNILDLIIVPTAQRNVYVVDREGT